MKKFILPFLLLTSVISLFGQTEDEKNRAAQEAERKKKLEATMGTVGSENGWARKGAIGLDLGQLFNLNPYLGSGSIDADSVVNKIDIKADTSFENWLENELQKRFNDMEKQPID